METIKLRYKKGRKIFIPQEEVDLPDDYELEIEKPVLKSEPEILNEKIEDYKKRLREEFVKEFKGEYGIDMSNDPFLELIGCESEYLSKTTYLDDKKRIIDAVTEKHRRVCFE